MAEKVVKKKRQMPKDDPDWTPGLSQPQKRAPGAVLRLIVLQRVTEEKVVAKLLEHLRSGKATTAMVIFFNKRTYPPPPNKLVDANVVANDNYNSPESKHRCKVEH